MRKNNTTEAHNRQRMLEYGRTHGGTKAALRYRYSRKTYYKWLKVWDGTWQSLQDRSRAPKTHPRKIDDETINKIPKEVQRPYKDLLRAAQSQSSLTGLSWSDVVAGQMRRAPADSTVRRTKQNYTDRDPQSRSGSIFFALLRKSPHLPLTALLRGNVSPMLDASTSNSSEIYETYLNFS